MNDGATKRATHRRSRRIRARSIRAFHMLFRHAGLAAITCVALLASRSSHAPLRPDPGALSGAPAELAERLRADPFASFRFVNRSWTTRVCAAFADVRDAPLVRLHGDAHVEQFALTRDAWGLTDFDDSTRGPEFVDIVRFLGSIDLATRLRGWTSDVPALTQRFFDGFRKGVVRAGLSASRAGHRASPARADTRHAGCVSRVG